MIVRKNGAVRKSGKTNTLIDDEGVLVFIQLPQFQSQTHRDLNNVLTFN